MRPSRFAIVAFCSFAFLGTAMAESEFSLNCKSWQSEVFKDGRSNAAGKDRFVKSIGYPAFDGGKEIGYINSDDRKMVFSYGRDVTTLVLNKNEAMWIQPDVIKFVKRKPNDLYPYSSKAFAMALEDFEAQKEMIHGIVFSTRKGQGMLLRSIQEDGKKPAVFMCRAKVGCMYSEENASGTLVTRGSALHKRLKALGVFSEDNVVHIDRRCQITTDKDLEAYINKTTDLLGKSCPVDRKITKKKRINFVELRTACADWTKYVRPAYKALQ